MAPTRSSRLLVLAILLFGAPAAGAGEDADEVFEREREVYEDYLDRPSLRMRYRGRLRFARTRDPRALDILAASYGRPEEPKDQVPYLVASVCADHFDAPEHLGTFAAWRRKHARPRDAWLWYRSLVLHHQHEGAEALQEIATGRKDGFLRAAALEALIERKDPGLLALVNGLLGDLPVKDLDRWVLLGSCAEALRSQAHLGKTPAFQAAAEKLVLQLDEARTPHATRLVIVRRMGQVFGAKELPLGAAPWLARLRGETPAPAAADPRHGEPKKPRFIGVEGTGARVCYVIDMSDSMLTPLTGQEVDDLRRPGREKPRPLTGPGSGPDPPRGEPGKDAEDEWKKLLSEADLPWERIRTRFDAAREFLKLSLNTLDRDQHFAVVFFGSEAGLLESTPGMRMATDDNVRLVVRELDAITAGPTKPDRPYGTLRGYTNLHGGMRRAFMVKTKRLVQEQEYVEPLAFKQGCDTVFLLSDGTPTWDDWPEWDRLEEEDVQGDPESGAKVERQKTAHFYGPYAILAPLLDDVRRLNLFRKVEINCVGLGEADPYLLNGIAQRGLGRSRWIGGRR